RPSLGCRELREPCGEHSDDREGDLRPVSKDALELAASDSEDAHLALRDERRDARDVRDDRHLPDRLTHPARREHDAVAAYDAHASRRDDEEPIARLAMT